MCRCCCCLSTLQLPLTRRAKSQADCCRERSASCLSSLCVSALPTYSRWHIHLFFGMRGELRTCWWFQTLQSAAGNFGILTDSRTLPAPGLSPLLIYLPDNLPLCVFVCACLLLPKITFRLLIKHQFSWQFNYKAREAQGQKRVKRVASCVDINSLQFAGHLLKTNIPHKCFI